MLSLMGAALAPVAATKATTVSVTPPSTARRLIGPDWSFAIVAHPEATTRDPAR